MTAVKALIRIAASELRTDLSSILAAALPNLASFLRKNQRALRLSTLALLDILVRNYTTKLTPESLKPVLIELPPLISEADLHIAQLTIDLLTSVSKYHKSVLPIVQQTSLPEVFKLAQSPLLQVYLSNIFYTILYWVGLFWDSIGCQCPYELCCVK